MEKRKLLFLVLLIGVILPTFLLNSCKEDPPPVDHFETLKNYLVTNNLDLNDILVDWVIAPKDVDSIQKDADANNDFYIMDIRDAADFALGHIATAVNVPLTNVVASAANAAGKTILVVCKTGQTAGHACVALRLKGYKAKVLKWGMSGWNADFDVWTAKTASIAVGNANWDAAPGNIVADADYSYPTITTTETEAVKILDERINAMLSSGLTLVSGSDALATPGNYFINNYWTAADVTSFGNLKGAHRINPLTIEANEIKKLDPSKTILVYCWTGQTSSMVSAYLKVLGYNVKSLSFGVNSLIYSNLTDPKVKWTKSGSFAYVK